MVRPRPKNRRAKSSLSARQLSLGMCVVAFLVGCNSFTQTAPDAGVPGSDGGPNAGTVPLVKSLVVAGDPDEGLGIFDPSIVYALGSDGGFLVYSVVPDALHVHARMGTSSDQGRSWSYVGEVNEAPEASVNTSDLSVCGQPTCFGTLIREVPSLVVDLDDVPSRRFKVFTHTYFTDGAMGMHRDIGYIELETSPGPGGPWTQTPLLGWNGSSPLSSTGVAQNASTDPALSGLSHCITLTEPGALFRSLPTGDVIDLALGCAFVYNGEIAIEIDLIRSTDHAASFTFVATLLSANDALALGSARPQISAPDLFQVGAKTYLFATPGGPVQYPGGGVGTDYRGCLTMEILDLDAGTLARTGGRPVVVSSFLGASLQFVGACSAAEGAPELGVAGDVLATSPPFFGIFATHRPAP